MAANIRGALVNARRKKNRPAIIEFITAGFPSIDATVPILLSLERSGVDVIELGIPHSDPLAEGATIQKSTTISLSQGVTPEMCIELTKMARQQGLSVPIIFMGYYNPIYIYGEEKFVVDARNAGVDGFIVVDLTVENSSNFRTYCKTHGLSFIPLAAPNTSIARLRSLVSIADSFIYLVSHFGVTGSQLTISEELINLTNRVNKTAMEVLGNPIPLAIGFGVSTHQHFVELSSLPIQGIVIGSALIHSIQKAIDDSSSSSSDEIIKDVTNSVIAFTRSILGPNDAEIHPNEPEMNGTGPIDDQIVEKTVSSNSEPNNIPSNFGNFGGCYAPESLMEALNELETWYSRLKDDSSFHREIQSYSSYVGRPTPLYHADRLSREMNGAQIWLKREDLAHTGAHKINNALGQALLAMRMGKRKIIAETGAGQHGVATATICAKLNLECIVFMGAIDMKRQELNVFRMKMLGAQVIPVNIGSKTLKDAVNEAMRYWIANFRESHYIVGSTIGPHPFPTIVRDFQKVIGMESKEQFSKANNSALPDYLVACVGGGSNSMGLFYPFLRDESVKIVGIEAGGKGLDTSEHCATLVKGTVGIIHGTKTLLLQNEHGMILETHSISAGLDYPGVGPEHAHLKESGRANYFAVNDNEALEGFKLLSSLEGILPALESSHAIYYACQLAKTLPKDKNILVCLSGRGDKDMETLIEFIK